jgi:outer membrane protein assembly factor BamB
VPTIAGDAVYTFGASGRLTCVALADGKERWSRDTHEDFGAQDGYFGAGSSPVVEGDKLLVNVGGRDGAGLVAFDTTTGKTVWKATNDAASYSSPVVATIDGARHAIFVTRLNIISVDPATGKERFREPFGMRGPTVNGANPLMLSDRLFLSASYGIGAKLFDVSGDGAKLQWESNDVMSSQYTTSVPAGEGLIGIDGRQDVGVARLRAFDPLTRKIHWTQEDFGMATLIAADNALVVMKTDGALVLIAPDLTKFRQLAAAQILPGTTRALPALADGRLYVRDERTLKCLDLGAN